MQHAVIHQEAQTGACVFQLEEGLDTGPVYSRIVRDLAPGETAGDVLADLSRSGADLLASTLTDLLAGGLAAEPQRGEPTFAPKLDQSDGFIDPARPAAEVAARINGTTPEPGAWAWLDDAETPVRVKLAGAIIEVVDEPSAAAAAAPGDLVRGRRTVHLQCADTTVRLAQVQPAGKKPMNASDWARGLPAEARFRSGVKPPAGSPSAQSPSAEKESS